MLTVIAATITFWSVFSEQTKLDLINYGEMVASHYNNSNPPEQLNNYNSESYGITLFGKDGVLLYQSTMDENKNEISGADDFPEIKEAFKNGTSYLRRHSTSVGEDVYFYAIKLNDNSVLRVSKESQSEVAVFFRFVPIVGMISAYILIICFFIAAKMTKKITKPIEDMALNKKGEVYEELKPFVKKIAMQDIEIRSQVESIQEQKDKIGAIIANMEEGLILLDTDKIILMKNDSAKILLGLPEQAIVGKNIFEVCSSRTLLHCISAGANGKNKSAEITLNGTTVQVLVNPVYTAGEQTGIVCLLMDVTHRQKTEKMRREFTANVSHELKTPLTSISGYAEMIETGMAKKEDIKKFAGKIHKEAGRLVSLISDIIKLSKLEDTESSLLEFSSINLFGLSKECAETLDIIAEKNNIKINVQGEDCLIRGDDKKIYELVYNLIDNAIRYNKPNGKVNVTVCKRKNKAVLKVEDTGIGIDEKHIERVFERFFREDKSRSKETGGTGLGLAIVKHTAEQHNAEIELESEKGVGTKITVVFELLSVF